MWLSADWMMILENRKLKWSKIYHVMVYKGMIKAEIV